MIGGIVLLVIGIILFITAQETIVLGGYGITVTNPTQQALGAGLGVVGLILTIVGAVAEED